MAEITKEEMIASYPDIVKDTKKLMVSVFELNNKLFRFKSQIESELTKIDIDLRLLVMKIDLLNNGLLGTSRETFIRNGLGVSAAPRSQTIRVDEGTIDI